MTFIWPFHLSCVSREITVFQNEILIPIFFLSILNFENIGKLVNKNIVGLPIVKNFEIPVFLLKKSKVAKTVHMSVIKKFWLCQRLNPLRENLLRQELPQI